jgi:hypothetical protein
MYPADKPHKAYCNFSSLQLTLTNTSSQETFGYPSVNLASCPASSKSRILQPLKPKRNIPCSARLALLEQSVLGSDTSVDRDKSTVYNDVKTILICNRNCKCKYEVQCVLKLKNHKIIAFQTSPSSRASTPITLPYA